MPKPGSMAAILLACVILALTPLPGRADDDFVILRTGETRTGTLLSCVGDRCRFGGADIMRSEIAWIGFGSEHRPPEPADPGADQVWLRDGRTLADPIVGISLGVIGTGSASVDRSNVVWVYFGSPRGLPSLPAIEEPAAEPSSAPEPRRGAVSPGVRAATDRAAAPAPQLEATPASPSTAANPALLLNEVRFLAGTDAPPFVEILNGGAESLSLEGWILRNERGQSIALPPEVAVPPGGLFTIYFDGGNAVEARALHASQREFLRTELAALEVSNGTERDLVAWGSERPGWISLCGAGRCGDPPPGSVIARLAGSSRPFTPSEWGVLEPGQATPGAPNRRPRVAHFGGFPGTIFPDLVKLSWYGVSGAARYRVQVASDEAFARVVHDRTVPASATRGLVQEMVEAGELPAGDYFWRVRAIGSAGEEAEFSRAIPFSVDSRHRFRTAGSDAFARPLPRLYASLQQSAEPEEEAAPAPGVRLAVPMHPQRKDTAMVMLEPVSEKNPRGWDTPDPDSGRPYCARSAIANVVSHHGGKISVDRIGYEAFRKEVEGPELDLPETGMHDDRTSAALEWALGTAGTYHKVTGERARRDACYEHLRQTGCEECPCPPEIAWQWGYEMIENIRREIDAGRPIIATSPSHAFVISGYAQEGERFYFVYHDESETYDAEAGASGLTRNMDSYWTGLSPVRLATEEPEIHIDSDRDGVVDFDEIHRFKTDPHHPDSDRDGIDDKKEIRLSVFDPEHGYAREILTPVSGHREIWDLAALANRRGRDVDGDGKPMELDPDSDDGGCDDGMEDVDRNGWRNGAETSNFVKSDDAVDEQGNCVELWVGTIHQVHHPAWMHRVTTTVDVRIREVDPKVPRAALVGAIDYRDLVDAGSIATDTHSTLPGWTSVISGHGSGPMGKRAGQLSRKVEAVEPDGSIRWSPWHYIVGLTPTTPMTYTDVWPDQSYTHEATVGAWLLSIGDGTGGDPEFRYVEDDCMVGSYSIEDGRSAVSWSICRQGAERPPLPDLP